MAGFSVPYPVGRISSQVKLRRGARTTMRQRILQVVLAAAASSALCLVLGHELTPLSPLTAMTTAWVFGSMRRRDLWIYFAGMLPGAAIGFALNPTFPARAAVEDILLGGAVGVIVGMGVFFLGAPREPVVMLTAAVQPVLTRIAENMRVVDSAIKSRDTVLAASAVYSLNDIEPELHQLDEALREMRRRRYASTSEDQRLLAECAQGAKEISYAVRSVRAAAWHTWWGVLRGCERIPAALPPIVAAFAEAVTSVRDELVRGGSQDRSRALLVELAHRIRSLRGHCLGISASAVVASIDSAILHLILATGTPVYDVDTVLHPPIPTQTAVHRR